MSVAAADNAPANLWWVQVRGKAYGPYAERQLRQYVGEGRVRPTSLIGQSAEGPWAEARTIPALMTELGAARALAVAHPEKAAPESVNMFVHAEINSSATAHFMAALAGLGLAVDLSPGLWLLRTQRSVGQVRNVLSQTLHTGDRFIVIDASRDRLAWYNLGPEVDVRIKDVWNASLPQGADAP
ncbi:MAG: DUF4339 domain-containing protein [Hyphomonadaceae bacterium]